MEPAQPNPTEDPPRDEPGGDEPGGDAPAGDDAPPDKAAKLRSERAEIAEEPGNHGVLAMGCSAAVALALIAFFVVRLLLMR